MQTTEVVIEIPVIGGGVLLAVTPLIAMALGEPVTAMLFQLDLRDLLVVVITILYPVGIAWNRVADFVFSRVGRRDRLTYFTERLDYHQAMIALQLGHPIFGARLSNAKSLYRIARASTLSLGIAAFTVPSSLVHDGSVRAMSWAPVALGGALALAAALCFWSWRHLRRSYLEWSKLALAQVGLSF